LNNAVATKRLELLHELVPQANVMAYLIDPANPNVETKEMQTAARKLGVDLHILEATAERDLDMVFAKMAPGGLMSYGSSLTDAYRLAGGYCARILKGEKPSELPVQQTTKIELYINLKSANTLGLSVPRALQARAEELIE
jgi:putative ABC transport system substrate-binding protein